MKALAEVPELVKMTKEALAANEELTKTIADVTNKRVEAEVPQDAVEKVVTAVTFAVRNTRCATPNMEQISDTIAKDVIAKASSAVRSAVREAAEDAVRDVDVSVEHTHVHSCIGYVLGMGDRVVKKVVLGLIAAIIVLMAGAVYTGIAHYNSPEYVGNEYAKVYYNPNTTKQEKEMLGKDTVDLSFLPKEYLDKPRVALPMIKRNQEILRQRAQQKQEKGKVVDYVPLER